MGKTTMPSATKALLLASTGCWALLTNAHAAEAQNGQAAVDSSAQTPAKPGAAKTTKTQARTTDDAPEEVIVTGVLSQTKQRKANVASTVLTEKDIRRFVPVSAADLLGEIPGVIIETQDGVTRNEVYTRGMTVGTGSNTSGYYWVTLQEDGLPVIYAKLSAFQDDGFYRADISTSRVESVRGGSTATGATNSPGGVFNFMSADVRPGGAVQVRVGFEGVDTHLTWRQVDGIYGWVNKDKDWGANISGFYRTSDGIVKAPYKTNIGGQFKSKIFHTYDAGALGSGTFTLTLKHLDDVNALLSSFAIPAYGYGPNFSFMPGWGRDTSTWLQAGVHCFADGGPSQTTCNDPSKGLHYWSDAATLKWEHNFNNGWQVSNVVKIDRNADFNQNGATGGVTPLANGNNFTALGVSPAAGGDGLQLHPGVYTLYDRDTGTVRATVAQNINGSQIGSDISTGKACTKQASPTSAAYCITYDNLPNQSVDLHAGPLTSSNNPALGAQPYGPSGPAYLVQNIGTNWTKRSERDIMGKFDLSRTAERLTLNFGAFYDFTSMRINSVSGGNGLAAWQNGTAVPLGVTFTDSTNGKVYQLTDPQGFGGAEGAGMVNQWMNTTEISPYFGFTWSPDDHWDFNASVKHAFFTLNKVENQLYQANAAVRAAGGVAGVPTLTTANVATYKDLTFGGLDGNPLTVYDNLYQVANPTGDWVMKHLHYQTNNYTLSAGYNFDPSNKIYARFTHAENTPIWGALLGKFSSAFGQQYLNMGPIQKLVQSEIGFSHRGRMFSSNVTYFYTTFEDPNLTSGLEADGVTVYFEPIVNSRYFTRGVEVENKFRLGAWFQWNNNITFNTGKQECKVSWALGQNGQSDDVMSCATGVLARAAKWSASNTFVVTYQDWQFNLRHRYMDRRKINQDRKSTLYLPTRNDLDFSASYIGIKNTQISLDVRNLTNSYTVSAVSRLYGTLPPGVFDYDLEQQYPNSATFVRINPPRSYWLTIRHDF